MIRLRVCSLTPFRPDKARDTADLCTAMVCCVTGFAAGTSPHLPNNRQVHVRLSLAKSRLKAGFRRLTHPRLQAVAPILFGERPYGAQARPLSFAKAMFGVRVEDSCSDV